MKRFFALFVLSNAVLLMAGSLVFGQSASGLQILDYEWKASRPDFSSARLPQFPNNDYAAVRDNPPTPQYQKRVGEEYYTLRRDAAEDSAYVDRAADKKTSFEAGLRLRNETAKKIDSFEADYVFYDQNGREFLRYRLSSDKNLDAGETVTIDKDIRGNSNEGYSKKLTRSMVWQMSKPNIKIELVRVDYADGTFWQAK